MSLIESIGAWWFHGIRPSLSPNSLCFLKVLNCEGEGGRTIVAFSVEEMIQARKLGSATLYANDLLQYNTKEILEFCFCQSCAHPYIL